MTTFRAAAPAMVGCRFYGRHCALATVTHTPCRMEAKGAKPDESCCELLAEAGKMARRVRSVPRDVSDAEYFEEWLKEKRRA